VDDVLLSAGAGTSSSNHFSNSILASLPSAELSALAPQLKEAELPLERVLFDEGGEVDPDQLNR
jgi:hypothetical protein